MKRRSGWAVLAAGALVASLLAVGASPAAAAEIKTGDENKASPSHTTKMTACLGAAEADGGFDDVEEGEVHYGAINCLKHYGVTVGMTATTFAPENNVSSFEMDLFMRRAAALVGADAEKVVGGVTMSDPVTRAEMAVLITNLLVASKHNEVKLGSDGMVSIAGDAASTFDYFADARRTQSRSVDAAISALYELGVANGTGDGTKFSPGDPVSRAEMAAFITRALAHTNARPAGLTAQNDGATVVVSIRDSSHRPENNVPVDAFWIDSERAGDAFDDDRECRGIVTAVDTESKECEIDDASTSTNSDGNARIYSLKSPNDKEVTVWAWQGENGDEVDSDTVLFDFTVDPVKDPTPHSKITVTEMSPKVPQVKFGQTYNLSAQLQASVPNDAGISKDVNVGPEKGGTTYVLVKELYHGKVGRDAAQKPIFNDSGVPTTGGDSPTALTEVRRTTELLTFNGDGLATFSVTATDPDTSAASKDDYRTVVWHLTDNATEGAKGTKVTTEVKDAVVFSEEASKLTALLVRATKSYVERPSSGSASNSMTVTALDQFHRPMNNIGVKLERVSTESPAVPGGYAVPTEAVVNTNDDFLKKDRHTDSTGSVRVSYKKSGGAETQTIIAVHDPDTGFCDVDHKDHANRGSGPDKKNSTEEERKDDCTINNNARSDDIRTPQTRQATVYWYDRTKVKTSAAKAVLDGSSADDEIVVAGADSQSDPEIASTDNPVLLTFDDNDIFRVGRDGGDDNTSIDDAEIRYVSMGDFEEALDEVLDPDKKLPTGTLAWSGYDHEDSDERTLFTLKVIDTSG